MATIKINQTTCISCATCWSLDPHHFIQGDDGIAKVIDSPDDKDPKTEKNVTKCANCDDAVASCPVGAISITD